MITTIQRKRTTFTYRAFSAFIAFTFIFSSVILPQRAQAQTILNLPIPGTMIAPSLSYIPATMAGMTIHPENPLKFDFIITTGEDNLQGEEFKKESQKLINYFLATLTVPDNEMWVNLSPYEKDRIIADGLGATEMGRDMLVQDYMLKQLTASLMYPEEELGGEFWKKVYAKSQARFGTTEIPTNTFNKVWIVPEEAVVYVNGTNVFVSESHLKIMLEEDYLALENNVDSSKHGLGEMIKDDIEVMSEEAKEVVREVILPEIEREVNEGKNFANLRQIYHSMILATWYKKNLKESVLGKVYMDQNKVKGIDLEDKQIKEKIYNQYVEAFKRGVYDYIREDHDPVTREIIPKKYFAGGLKRTEVREQREGESLSAASPIRIAMENRIGVRRVEQVFEMTDARGEVVSSPVDAVSLTAEGWDVLVQDAKTLAQFPVAAKQGAENRNPFYIHFLERLYRHAHLQRIEGRLQGRTADMLIERRSITELAPIWYEEMREQLIDTAQYYSFPQDVLEYFDENIDNENFLKKLAEDYPLVGSQAALGDIKIVAREDEAGDFDKYVIRINPRQGKARFGRLVATEQLRQEALMEIQAWAKENQVNGKKVIVEKVRGFADVVDGWIDSGQFGALADNHGHLGGMVGLEDIWEQNLKHPGKFDWNPSFGEVKSYVDLNQVNDSALILRKGLLENLGFSDDQKITDQMIMDKYFEMRQQMGTEPTGEQVLAGIENDLDQYFALKHTFFYFMLDMPYEGEAWDFGWDFLARYDTGAATEKRRTRENINAEEFAELTAGQIEKIILRNQKNSFIEIRIQPNYTSAEETEIVLSRIAQVAEHYKDIYPGLKVNLGFVFRKKESNDRLKEQITWMTEALSKPENVHIRDHLVGLDAASTEVGNPPSRIFGIIEPVVKAYNKKQLKASDGRTHKLRWAYHVAEDWAPVRDRETKEPIFGHDIVTAMRYVLEVVNKDDVVGLGHITGVTESLIGTGVGEEYVNLEELRETHKWLFQLQEEFALDIDYDVDKVDGILYRYEDNADNLNPVITLPEPLLDKKNRFVLAQFIIDKIIEKGIFIEFNPGSKGPLIELIVNDWNINGIDFSGLKKVATLNSDIPGMFGMDNGIKDEYMRFGEILHDQYGVPEEKIKENFRILAGNGRRRGEAMAYGRIAEVTDPEIFSQLPTMLLSNSADEHELTSEYLDYLEKFYRHEHLQRMGLLRDDKSLEERTDEWLEQIQATEIGGFFPKGFLDKERAGQPAGEEYRQYNSRRFISLASQAYLHEAKLLFDERNDRYIIQVNTQEAKNRLGWLVYSEYVRKKLISDLEVWAQSAKMNGKDVVIQDSSPEKDQVREWIREDQLGPLSDGHTHIEALVDSDLFYWHLFVRALKLPEKLDQSDGFNKKMFPSLKDIKEGAEIFDFNYRGKPGYVDVNEVLATARQLREEILEAFQLDDTTFDSAIVDTLIEYQQDNDRFSVNLSIFEKMEQYLALKHVFLKHVVFLPFKGDTSYGPIDFLIGYDLNATLSNASESNERAYGAKMNQEESVQWNKFLARASIDQHSQNGALQLRIQPKYDEEELHAILKGIGEEIERGSADNPDMKTYIVIALRKRESKEMLKKQMEWLVNGLRKYPELRKYVKGIDTASLEQGNPPKKFVESFNIADEYNREGLKVPGSRRNHRLVKTYHVAEMYGQVGPFAHDVISAMRHGYEVIKELKPQSLGHFLAVMRVLTGVEPMTPQYVTLGELKETYTWLLRLKNQTHLPFDETFNDSMQDILQRITETDTKKEEDPVIKFDEPFLSQDNMKVIAQYITKLVIKSKIFIEFNPVSNMESGSVFDDHPLVRLIVNDFFIDGQDFSGLRELLTINTDDPGMWDVRTVADEFANIGATLIQLGVHPEKARGESLQLAENGRQLSHLYMNGRRAGKNLFQPTEGSAMTARGQEEEVKNTAIAQEVEAAWADPASTLNRIKKDFQGRINRAVKNNSVIVLSPHNYRNVPFDGDTISTTAGIYKQIKAVAVEIGRTIRFVASVDEVIEDGVLNVLLFPTEDGNKGFTKERAAELNRLKDVGGKKLLFVGDNRFWPVDDYVGEGNVFDELIVQDHHVWPDELLEELHAKYGDRDDVFWINNHEIFTSNNRDKYSSGAFQADLSRQEEDNDWYDFARLLGTFSDGYQKHFPQLTEGIDEDHAEYVANMLNFVGTYIGTVWKEDGEIVDMTRKMKAIAAVIETITNSDSFEQLHAALTKTFESELGFSYVHFMQWQEEMQREVKASLEAFLASEDRVFIYEIKAKENIALLVHKRAFILLDGTGQYGKRVFFHYQVADDGFVTGLWSRDSDYSELMLDEVSLNGPGGAAWGGGKGEKAGFGIHPDVRATVEKALGVKMGEEGFVEAVLDFVRSATETLMDSAASSPVHGGIDFNPNTLNLSQQGQAINFTIDNSMFQNLQPGSIYGIQPVIINITPVTNIPLLLGELEERSDEFSLSQLN